MSHTVTKHFTVSTWDVVRADEARAEALRRFGERMVSPLSAVMINGWTHFAVWSTGSKAGWGNAESHDRAVSLFVEWLEEQRYEDGSSPFKWSVVDIDDDGDVSTLHAMRPRKDPGR